MEWSAGSKDTFDTPPEQPDKEQGASATCQDTLDEHTTYTGINICVRLAA